MSGNTDAMFQVTTEPLACILHDLGSSTGQTNNHVNKELKDREEGQGQSAVVFSYPEA